MSEANNPQLSPEVLQRLQMFVNAYEKGTAQRKAMFINANGEHEEHVTQHWKDALASYFQREVRVSSERVNYRTTRTTFSLQLSDASRCEAITFLASHFDRTLDQILSNIKDCANDAVQRKKSANGRAGLVFLPLFLLAMLIAILKDQPFYHHLQATGALLPIGLGLLCLLAFAIVLMCARSSALRRAAKKAGNPQETLESFCDVYAAGVFQNASRPAMGVCAAMLAGVGIFAYIRSLPPPLEERVKDTATGYNSTVPVSALDSLLLKNGQLDEAAVKALKQTLDGFPAGSEHALQLAVYAALRTDAGYPDGDAQQALDAQLAALNLSEFAADSNLKLLEDIVRLLPGTRDPLYDRWLATGNPKRPTMATTFGQWWKADALDVKVDRAAEAAARGLSGDNFLEAALTEADLPGLRTLLDSATEPARITLLARALAGPLRDPAEIVPLLYQLRQRGVSLAETFPEGLVISLDLEHLNLSHNKDNWEYQRPDGDRYLILSRTEHNEPKEQKLRQPADNYDAHNKADPDIYTVRVETAYMDRVPLDHMPAAWEECDILIVADMTFMRESTITRTSTTTGKSYSKTVSYYPTYGRLYRIIMAERDGIIPLPAYNYKYVRPDSVSSKNSSMAYLIDLEISSKYLAKADDRWTGQQLNAVLDALEKADWSNMMFLLLQYSQENAA